MVCYVKLSRKRLDFEKLSRDRGHQPRTLYSSLSNRPPKICPHRQIVPQNLIPLAKWSPTNSVPIFFDPYSLSPGQTEYSRDHLSMGDQIFVDRPSMRTKLDGDCLSRGAN